MDHWQFKKLSLFKWLGKEPHGRFTAGWISRVAFIGEFMWNLSLASLRKRQEQDRSCDAGALCLCSRIVIFRSHSVLDRLDLGRSNEANYPKPAYFPLPQPQALCLKIHAGFFETGSFRCIYFLDLRYIFPSSLSNQRHQLQLHSFCTWS